MDTEKQRHQTQYDARLTKSGNARSKQLLMVPMYRVANQLQRMATRRALEWIGMLKAWLFFGYEISELFVFFFLLARFFELLFLALQL